MAHPTASAQGFSVAPAISWYNHEPVTYRPKTREEAAELDRRWPGHKLPMGPLGLLQYPPATIKRVVGAGAEDFVAFRAKMQAMLKKRARKISSPDVLTVAGKAAAGGSAKLAKFVASDRFSVGARKRILQKLLEVWVEAGHKLEDVVADAATASQGDSDSDSELLITE
jgi:hypothetical protein